MGKQESQGCVTRRGLFSIVAGCLVAAYARPARADLFGGDIGVLLAQLQQQLTLVSNAIQQVRGIYATFEGVKRTYDETKKFASNVTGSGGLDGFLRGAQGLVDTGRGVLGNLQYVNVHGGAWKDTIIRQGGSMTLDQVVRLSQDVNDFDRRMIRDATRVADSFASITSSFDALRAAGSAARDAESVLGMVGQAKLLNRQMVQLAGISAQMASMFSTSGQLQAGELQRQAASREVESAYRKQLFGRYGRPEEAQPVDSVLLLEE